MFDSSLTLHDGCVLPSRACAAGRSSALVTVTIRLALPACCFELHWRALGDDAALVDHHDVVGELIGFL
jgi:hypothetical protein